jgi:hypothetical protein
METAGGILWYNSSTGETQIWLMNGAQVSARETVLGQDGKPAFIGPPFAIVGVGDFNRDGGADILWYNSSTGETQIWLMNGAQVSARETVLGQDGKPTFIGPPFAVVGVGAFHSVPASPAPPTIKTFDQGVTTDIAVGGSAHVVMKSDGSFTFSSHAHDSGFDNIDYTISAACMTPDGIIFTFQHSGHTEGTTAGLPFGTPNRNDDFPTGGQVGAGTNPQITAEWPGVLNASFTASIAGTDTLAQGIKGAIDDLVNSLLAEAGKAAAAAIIALV